MRLRDLTLDELEDLEKELHENGEQSNFGYYAKLINVYEEMYKRIVPLVRNDRAMYYHSLQYTKKLLVSYLVKYVLPSISDLALRWIKLKKYLA